jgi:hypothetical protein
MEIEIGVRIQALHADRLNWFYQHVLTKVRHDGRVVWILDVW